MTFFSQIFKLIHQIWHKPSTNRLFAPRLKKVYRLLNLSPFLVGAVFFLLNYFSPHVIQVVQLSIITYITSPIISLFNKANHTIQKVTHQSLSLYHCIHHHQAYNAETLHNQIALLQTQLRIAQDRCLNLQQLAHLPLEKNKIEATTEAIGHVNDGFRDHIYIKANHFKVHSHMVAITPQGLVGKIVSWNGRIAKIMTIYDWNFKVPFTIPGSSIQGIASGAGNHMRIEYFEKPSLVTQGQVLVTSGEGGLFIPNIPIGIIQSAKPPIKVYPFIQPSQIQFISILAPSSLFDLENCD